MVEDGCKMVEYSPVKRRTSSGRRVARKLRLHASPVGKLLAERRGARVPPAIHIPGAPKDDMDGEEDTRADYMTDSQRDILFSSATR